MKKRVAVGFTIISTLLCLAAAQGVSPQANRSIPDVKKLAQINQGLELISKARAQVIVMAASIRSRDLAKVLYQRAGSLRRKDNPMPIKIIVADSDDNRRNPLLGELARTPGIGVRAFANLNTAAIYIDRRDVVISMTLVGLPTSKDYPDWIMRDAPGFAANNSVNIEANFNRYPSLWRSR
jgi:hypothetical protein